MKYGCIGEHLKHSFSKEIHNALADYEYEIAEIPRDKLDDFARARDFAAINVTIPYKELIMPHLSFVDEHAKMIGAVNTVVNRGGELYGYNTDFYGMSELIRHAGIEISGKKVIILGTGGTSKTAHAVARTLGAREVLRVSRSGRENSVSYDELYKKHNDAEIIINTTPIGMFPDIFGMAADLSKFPAISGVIDAVYNPLRTPLVSEAERRGIPAEGGLYMLVAQAVRASEIFTDTEYPHGVLDEVFERIYKEKENIVLIGMPGSGKSTVGKMLADKLKRQFIDTDEMIVVNAGCEITEIFERHGECGFRDIESDVINEAAALTGAVIATGGGAVLRGENVAALKQNGKLYFIDRPIEALIPTKDRPLANSADAIKKRYKERYEIYSAATDVKINADMSAEEVAEEILSR